jgi:radical SAM superfamily enzyme YgiQ (UPF0313 family)
MGTGLPQKPLRATGKNRSNITAPSARRFAQVGPLHVWQFTNSRGCPFTCEFCDIIVTFGRRPRLKTSEQVLAELESFRRAGLGIIFVVDDNLIGNKKAIKPVLREIVRWQQERAYPLTLFTEASLDLAEDEELMVHLCAQGDFSLSLRRHRSGFA